MTDKTSSKDAPREGAGGSGCACDTESLLPEVTFSAFIISLASAALVGLGEVADPATGRVSRDLLLARHNIDVLEMLRQKTEGGLNAKERALLDQLLCDLHLKYVINSDAKAASGASAKGAGAC
ncbi:DUF1844 domain-containing protein [Desulfovibrio sp.]|uniref:DUF1844 domain-containing protein n=1 Tax=Desulfovibrio sp. TaxID=885 RepID=UPI0023C2E0B4|nr:DUF1844 domain-containing protein [Desulfovibrio sp.]MDE7242018.1 DUF1844 domain-containing protein [Desulfovibrio sp.]